MAHPVNPPYYVPLVEIVPAPWTDKAVAKKTREIMEEIGQEPVSLSKEIPGFALNRIQYVRFLSTKVVLTLIYFRYAILQETWNLVTDGVLDVKDIDKVMSEGLGMRYAFLGPLETTHLNAEGFLDYCNRYTSTIKNVSSGSEGTTTKFGGPMKLEVNNQLEAMVPLDQLQNRRNWRDMCLTKLAALKKSVKQ